MQGVRQPLGFLKHQGSVQEEQSLGRDNGAGPLPKRDRRIRIVKDGIQVVHVIPDDREIHRASAVFVGFVARGLVVVDVRKVARVEQAAAHGAIHTARGRQDGISDRLCFVASSVASPKQCVVRIELGHVWAQL